MSSGYVNVLTPPSSNEDSPGPTYFEASPNSSIFTSPQEQLAPLSPPGQVLFNLQTRTLGNDMLTQNNGDGPRLRFVEQPIDKFRFRYRSEMAGTHGSLTGINSDRSRKSTYPTVELLNYDGPAIVRCSIYQMAGVDKDFMPHAHRLIMKRGKEELDDPHNIPVGPKEGYTAQFHSMGIIHTAKKHLVNELVRKKEQLRREYVARMESQHRELTFQERMEIRGSAEQESKSINLNIVCLRFDAFIISNDIWYPICRPLYSHGINNLKSPLTGELKIVRMDHCTSPASGDKEIFLLVERVTKKNVRIRFYELKDSGEVAWEGYGKFTDMDVHHQYAIVFKTPKFRDENISHPVKVYMELMRPSDGAASEPREFTYVPCRDKRGGKRARTNSYSSSSSYSWSGAIANNQLPEPVNTINLGGGAAKLPSPFATIGSGEISNLSSAELRNALADINSDEFKKLFDQFGVEYEHALLPAEDAGITFAYAEMGPAVQHEMEASHSVDTPRRVVAQMMDDMRPNFQSDPWLLKNVVSKFTNLAVSRPPPPVKHELDPQDVEAAERTYAELRSFIKTTHTKERARNILEYHLGANNRTNALHVFICQNRIEEVTFIMKMVYLTQYFSVVNSRDKNNSTALHLAVSKHNPHFVKFLLRCKADCSIVDSRGNTALHVAVEESAPVEILEILAAATDDLNVTNYDGNTPLLIAVENKSMQAVRILCRRQQVDINRRHPKNGYTALRLAIEKDHIDVLRFLLSLPNLNPNVKDFNEVTAFGAAAIKECSKEMLDTIKTYMRDNDIEIQVKDEPDDEDDEEDDDEEMEETDNGADVKSETASPDDLEKAYRDVSRFTPKCLAEVSAVLNASGNWRHLADLLGLDHLLTSGIVPAKGNASEDLLVYATEVHNDSMLQIRNFLENLEEKEAVEAIDRMARGGRQESGC